ncbi:MAG TPA: alpha/beta fold hydrolase [Methanomassiliicoccales archaeon]|nr:alpha/beta fold hydrolase [Methanomassiliicoccales archaeon]
MKIESTSIEGDGFRVPLIRIAPRDPVGAAVVVHGYGGCKEEQLGLAWRVAETGLLTDCIDLRGHGDHELPFDKTVLEDVEAAVAAASRSGKVVAIGHSLGGRLSLASSADFAIGISPPLDVTYGERTEELLRKLRSHKVRLESERTVFDVIENLPKLEGRASGNLMIIYGSRDIPEIVRACERLNGSTGNVLRVEGAMHSDTYLMPATFEGIANRLANWFPRPHRA